MGAALAHSTGSGAYSSHADDGHGAGEVKSRVTGFWFYPYAHYALNPQLSFWGVVGYGRGELTLTPDGGVQQETALSLSMAALGMKGLLRDGGAEGLTIESSANALWVRTSTDAADGDDGTGRLEGSEAEVSRLRLGLQASRPFQLGDGAAVTPSLEIGLRQDGGDAETGFGTDLGAGLVWADQTRGLSAELKGRVLLSHEADGFQDHGFAASLSWDPDPSSEREPSLFLSQTMSGAATGGVEALLSPVTMEDMSNGNGRQQFEARLAYGLPVHNNRLTLSPLVVLSLDPSSRATTIGWSLSPEEATDPWQFSMEAQRQESNSSDTTADHELEIRFSPPF